MPREVHERRKRISYNVFARLTLANSSTTFQKNSRLVVMEHALSGRLVRLLLQSPETLTATNLTSGALAASLAAPNAK